MKDLKPVYTAVSEAAALDTSAEFSGKWEKRYRAIIRLWENAWAECVPFLRSDNEVRTITCTTNAIESINVRLRPAEPGPRSKGRKRWSNWWKQPSTPSTSPQRPAGHVSSGGGAPYQVSCMS